jgi:protein-arginine kinase activator protein McsA
MSKRREFTVSVDKEIRARARDANGELRCEECHTAVKRGEVHHVKADALEVDKSRKLTAKDGIFLCIPCHKGETKRFAPVIAKVRRVEAKHVGAVRPASKIQSPGFAKGTKPKRDTRAPAHGQSEISRRFR